MVWKDSDGLPRPSGLYRRIRGFYRHRRDADSTARTGQYVTL